MERLSGLVKSTGRETPAQKNKRDRIITYLNDRLEEVGGEGVVRSIVLLNKKNGAICCYEHQIKNDSLFVRLNLGIGVNSIKYRPTHELRIEQCHQGIFVRLNKFENCDKGYWVVLLNISITEDEIDWGKTIPFSPPAKSWKRT